MSEEETQEKEEEEEEYVLTADDSDPLYKRIKEYLLQLNQEPAKTTSSPSFSSPAQSFFSQQERKDLRNIRRIPNKFLSAVEEDGDPRLAELKKIDLSFFDESKNLSFCGSDSMCLCSKVETLNLEPLRRLEKIKNGFLFGASSLVSLDTSPLKNSLQKVGRQFCYNCQSLTSLNLSGFQNVNAIRRSFLKISSPPSSSGENNNSENLLQLVDFSPFSQKQEGNKEIVIDGNGFLVGRQNTKVIGLAGRTKRLLRIFGEDDDAIWLRKQIQQEEREILHKVLSLIFSSSSSSASYGNADVVIIKHVLKFF